MFLTIQGHRIEYEFTGDLQSSSTIVFLHEGLGSIAMWKDFPARCGRAAGCRALIYSRYGYGSSDPLIERRSPDYMHVEALRALPELLDRLEIQRPILFGHSDGASIALIHAGCHQIKGAIAMAPHVFVEEEAVTGVLEIANSYATAGLREKLARYHAHPDSAFFGWSEIWTDPAFRSWNIEQYLTGITAPVLAIQGEDDEYGTMQQLDRIAASARSVELLKLPNCRHSPHRDQPDSVIDAAARFVGRLS